ncbi:MAG: GNAT family N-acetyltransferase [Anaerolineales bacterium]|nr:GNAT family N-acetyltransferase [Anaerolineales bacterium]
MRPKKIVKNSSGSENPNVLIRSARDQDIPAVVEIDSEIFAPYGISEKPETFQLRLNVFPDGFIIMVADNEIAAFGCSEKWLVEREPGLDENPQITHQPEGRILCITAIAVKMRFREMGYDLLMLDKLIEIAHREGCKNIVLATAQMQGLYLQRGFKKVKSRTERGALLDVMSIDIESYGSKA